MRVPSTSSKHNCALGWGRSLQTITRMPPYLQCHAAASVMAAAGMRLEDITDPFGHRFVMVTAGIYKRSIASTRDAHIGVMNQVIPMPGQGIGAPSIP